MRGLDYRSVVGQRPNFDSDTKAFVLRLGLVELEPISYSTLVALRDCPVVVRELLDLCFNARPVMWTDLRGSSSEDWQARMAEIEVLLGVIDERLESSDRPDYGVLARIVELWRGQTRAALEQFETSADSDSEALARSVVPEYRRSVFPCVEALLQLLSEEDESSIRARARLEEARGTLGNPLSADATLGAGCGWLRAEVGAESEDRAS